jgi:hypothetical protein
LAAGLIVVATAGLAACGGSSTDGADRATVTTEAPSTTAPVDYRSAMVSRLTDEWGEATVAEQVVTAIGPDGLAAWEAKVPMNEVATTPLLTYRPAGVPADQVDSVVVFAFGNRVAADGTVSPGPTNQELADVTAAFVAEHPVPVYAQWEVARLMIADGVEGVNSIEPTTDAAGNVVYLSTRGVADAVAGSGEAALGRIGVICFADHEGRCLLTADAAGLDAAAIDGLDLPSTYDTGSGQPWTRSRVAYLTTDLQGRLLG